MSNIVSPFWYERHLEIVHSLGRFQNPAHKKMNRSWALGAQADGTIGDWYYSPADNANGGGGAGGFDTSVVGGAYGTGTGSSGSVTDFAAVEHGQGTVHSRGILAYPSGTTKWGFGYRFRFLDTGGSGSFGVDHAYFMGLRTAGSLATYMGFGMQGAGSGNVTKGFLNVGSTTKYIAQIKSTSNLTLVSAQNVALTTWHTGLMVSDGTTAYFWLDGELLSGGAVAPNATVVPFFVAKGGQFHVCQNSAAFYVWEG